MPFMDISGSPGCCRLCWTISVSFKPSRHYNALSCWIRLAARSWLCIPNISSLGFALVHRAGFAIFSLFAFLLAHFADLRFWTDTHSCAGSSTVRSVRFLFCQQTPYFSGSCVFAVRFWFVSRARRRSRLDITQFLSFSAG